MISLEFSSAKIRRLFFSRSYLQRKIYGVEKQNKCVSPPRNIWLRKRAEPITHSFSPVPLFRENGGTTALPSSGSLIKADPAYRDRNKCFFHSAPPPPPPPTRDEDLGFFCTSRV